MSNFYVSMLFLELCMLEFPHDLGQKLSFFFLIRVFVNIGCSTNRTKNNFSNTIINNSCLR
ncbi:163L [Invertebrate iridescent virus 6]|uniref:163L n=1 Tax=Invertebrate iridescent virus 6 TaxID=176652 RepID=Q91FZ5_IIV6|nr:163L [Invertebrate iridescent virus 6]AAK82037.1 163L [Invertebrate iridescent virus 6]QMS79581.1 hypothetical protein IIV6-T1_163 [Invertebrate iridescent virus 6]